jgi:hypothetical protein
MAKGITRSNANHRHFGINYRRKVLRSGCVAAVMSNLGD